MSAPALLGRLRSNSLVRSAAGYGLGTSVYKLYVLALIPLFARGFGAGEQGVLELATSAGGLTAAIVALNLNTVVSQRYAQSAGPDDRIVQAGFGLVTMLSTTVVGLLLSVPASLVLVATFPEFRGRYVLVLLALLAACFTGFFGNMTYLFQLRSKTRPFNVVHGLWAAVALSGTFAYFKIVRPRADGFLLATLAAGVLASVVGVSALRGDVATMRRVPAWPQEAARIVRTDIRRGLRLFPIALLAWALLYIDRKLLSSASNLDELGVYGISVRVANSVTFFLGPIQAAWWASSMNADDERLVVDLRRVIQLQGAFALLFVIGAAIAGQDPFPGILGSWFRPAVRLVPMLVLCATLTAGYVLPQAVLTRQGRYRPMFIAHASAVATDIVLNLALDHRFGAAGATFANLCAYLVLNAVAWWPVRSALREAVRGVGVRMLALPGLAVTGALLLLLFPHQLLTGYR